MLARRRDLIIDQGRTITRLREVLLSLFSGTGASIGSERQRPPFILLTRYQTPTHLRRAGHKRVATYLRNRSVKGSANVAHKALSAARSQSVSLPAQEVASRIVAELAKKMSWASR